MILPNEQLLSPPHPLMKAGIQHSWQSYFSFPPNRHGNNGPTVFVTHARQLVRTRRNTNTTTTNHHQNPTIAVTPPTMTTSNSSSRSTGSGITPVGWALIVGSIAIVSLLCFFLACVWRQYHHRRHGRDEEDDDDDTYNNHKRSPLQIQHDQPSTSSLPFPSFPMNDNDDDEQGHRSSNIIPPPPLKTSRKQQQQQQQQQLQQHRRSWTASFFGPDENGAGQAPGNGTLAVVPPVVQLDDDHRSLANTTLGDQTAGRKKRRARKKKTSALTTTPKGNTTTTTSAAALTRQNSFDEASLYTTPSVFRPIDMASSNSTNVSSSSASRKPKMTWNTKPNTADDDEGEEEKVEEDHGTLSKSVNLAHGTTTSPTTKTTPTSTTALREGRHVHKESVEVLYGQGSYNTINNKTKKYPTKAAASHTNTTTASGGGSHSSHTSSSGPVDVDTAQLFVDESSILTPRAPFKPQGEKFFSPLQALKRLSEDPLVLTFEDHDDDEDDSNQEVGTVDVDDLMTDVGDDSDYKEKQPRGAFPSSSSPSSSRSRKLAKMILYGVPEQTWRGNTKDEDDDDDEEKQEVELLEADFSQEVSYFDPPGSYYGTSATPSNKRSNLRKLPPSPLDRKRQQQTQRSMTVNKAGAAAASPKKSRGGRGNKAELQPPSKNQHLNNMKEAAKTLNQRPGRHNQAQAKVAGMPVASKGMDENDPPQTKQVAESIKPIRETLLRGWIRDTAPDKSSKSLSPVAQHFTKRAALSTLSGPALKDDQVEQDTPPSHADTISVNSSSSTAISNNPWLFGTVEDTLGPRSPAADLESLSGRSNRSGRSQRSTRSRKSTKSNPSGKASLTSSKSRQRGGGGNSVASRGSSKASGDTNQYDHIQPRSLEHDLKRLERQLAALEHHVTDLAGTESASRGGGSRSTASVTSSARRRKVSQRQRMVVICPPGKLGVVLANRHDGGGTVVSEVKSSSVLHGAIIPGDKLIAVDDDDVTGMVVSEIISLMASRSDKERRLTVITTKSKSIAHVQ